MEARNPTNYPNRRRGRGVQKKKGCPNHECYYSIILVDVSYEPAHRQAFLTCTKPTGLVLQQSNFRPRKRTGDINFYIYLTPGFDGISALPYTLQLAHIALSQKEVASFRPAHRRNQHRHAPSERNTHGFIVYQTVWSKQLWPGPLQSWWSRTSVPRRHV